MVSILQPCQGLCCQRGITDTKSEPQGKRSRIQARNCLKAALSKPEHGQVWITSQQSDVSLEPIWENCTSGISKISSKSTLKISVMNIRYKTKSNQRKKNVCGLQKDEQERHTCSTM